MSLTSDLNRTAHIASVPGNETHEIKRSFLDTGYALMPINSLIKQFSQNSSETDDFIIPTSLFKIPKKVCLV